MTADAVIAAAGIDDHVTSHILTHTFSTELTRRSADLMTVAESMGHTSLD